MQAEHRAVETVQGLPLALGLALQPAQRQLVSRGEEQQGTACAGPCGGQVRMPDGEFECSVRALDSLRAGRQVSPGDQVEARALGVRHGTSIRSPRKPCQIRSVKPVVRLVAAWPSRGRPANDKLPGRPANDKNVAFMSLSRQECGIHVVR